MNTAIVWFRRDLRLSDNPALHQALQRCERIVPVYIHSPDIDTPWRPGAASDWWLHESLKALDDLLRDRGSALIIRQGDARQVLLQIAAECQAREIHWNRLYEPTAITRDSRIKSELSRAGYPCHSHNAALLIEPWEIKTGKGTPYKVFTAFWKACSSRLTPQTPLAAPSALAPVDKRIVSLPVQALGLLPAIDWYQKFSTHWTPGELGAASRLEHFLIHGLSDYAEGRDLPAGYGTSRLSPHLHFGEIGPRQILWGLVHHAPRLWETGDGNLQRYYAELGWREFAHHLLFHYPETTDQPLDGRFHYMPWDDSEQALQNLERWKHGVTGIPIVDAGMRELWETGWMHNRVRMIVASLLCKNLGIHWLEGARWFWDTLLDADLANNTLGWQWTAGCGADAAPFFRIFNPVRQAERFDPQGQYTRRWVPELSGLPPARLHAPWERGGVSTYPAPITDLARSRRQALERWEHLRSTPSLGQ